MKNAKKFAKGKSVYCKTDNKAFISCVEAGAEYCVHPSYIGMACNGKVKEIRGKTFRWLTDKGKDKVAPKGLNWRDKAVYCITHDEEFPSGKMAGVHYGIPANGISDVCNGKLKKTHKMRFCFVVDKAKYADEIAATKASRKVRVTAKFITHKRKEV